MDDGRAEFCAARQLVWLANSMWIQIQMEQKDTHG
jgi:hypothetical protein